MEFLSFVQDLILYYYPLCSFLTISYSIKNSSIPLYQKELNSIKIFSYYKFDHDKFILV